jgi:hypothetical protein
LGGAQARNYFFLNPAGHFGLTAVTFFVTLPLVQVMVVFLRLGVVTVFFVEATGALCCATKASASLSKSRCL